MKQISPITLITMMIRVMKDTFRVARELVTGDLPWSRVREVAFTLILPEQAELG